MHTILQCKTHNTIYIYRIAQTIRKEMFNSRGVFDGDVSIKRQKESVPSLLIQLLSVILEGEKADIDSSPGLEKIVTNVAQIIRYHAVKERRAVKTFRASCAPPLLIATGLRAYSDNRSKKRVDDLASEGLSISYKRVKSIRKAITQQICNEYQESGLVVPNNLKIKCFTTCAFDNID